VEKNIIRKTGQKGADIDYTYKGVFIHKKREVNTGTAVL